MASGSLLQIYPFSIKPSAPPVGSYLFYMKTDNTLYLEDSSGNEYAFGTTSAISQLTGDVSALGPGSAVATVNFVGGQTAANIASATVTVLDATSSATPSTLVIRDSSGNFNANVVTASLVGNVTGNVSGSATSFTGSLSGDVTGTQGATSISSSTVTGKLLTGYSVGSNTPILATDTILQAFEKVQGQLNATELSSITALTGDGSATGPGSVPFTLATVNTNVGSFGSSTSIPSFTVNAKGLITAASGSAVIAPANTLTGTTLASNVVSSSLTSVGYLNSLAVSGYVGIGTNSPVAPLDIEVTTTAINGTNYGIKEFYTINPPSSNTAEYEGFGNVTATQLGNTSNMYLLKSGYHELSHNGIGTITYATGLGAAVYNAQSGTIQNAFGTYLGVYNTNGGTINTGYGAFIDTPNNSANPGTIGTWYGIYISNSTVGATNYGVYSQGGLNYFGGLIEAVGGLTGNVNYTPATPSNWPIVPTTVQQGLDDLAASVSGISGSAITSLHGDIVATGPGAVSATIQPNVVTNSKLAQMAAGTIKGNNTGSTTNPQDLSVAQVTAMLNPFVGDTGSGGTQGLVPTPPSGSKAAGDFLAANGSWAYVDQSKPLYNPFSFIATTPWTGSTASKFQNLAIYTGIDGHKQYAAVVAGGSSGTLFIWDITDPFIPVLCSYTSLLGAYNISVAQISGAIYAFVPSSGGSTLYTINVTNPYSLTTTSSLTISGSPGALYSCVYSNGYVYIATQNKGLTVVDVGGGLAGGTITAPIQSFQEGGTTNKTGGVAIFGNIVYTTNYQTTYPATVRYLKTWELAAGGGTLAVPFLANTYTISGGPVGTSTKPLGISISPSGTTAYVTDGNQNVINIIDVTSPTAPNYLAYVTPSYVLADNTLESAVVSATIAGNYLYIPSGSNATNGGCIDLFDVTTPSTPIKVNSIYTGVPNDVFGGIALNNGYIFGADYGVSGGYSGLSVFTQAFLNPTYGLPITSNIEVQQLTPNTALIANGSKQLASSTTTATELSYVHGVTSPIQTQINSIVGGGITSLTGDVVGVGPGATATTIQPNVITNAKLAQAPANTIKGNNTSSTANEQDLTTSQVATMLGSYFDAAGDAATVQTNLNNYINPTSLQFGWNYQNPHYYTQMIYTGSEVTEIIYWDSPSMITQIFTKNITYTGGLATQVVLTRIADSTTLTKTIAYSGSNVSSVTRS